MGRPIHKRNFAGGLGGGIKVSAKIDGVGPKTGVIVKQTGTKTYLVDLGDGVVGKCVLVDKENEMLLDGECCINAKTEDGVVVRVTKLTNRLAKTNSGETIAWSAGTSSGSTGGLVVETQEDEDFDPVINLPLPGEIVYSFGTINDRFKKANGTLLNGSGNDANNMMVVTNGEIEIGARFSKYKKGQSSAPVDGVYNFVLKQDEDWNFPYNVGLLGDAAQYCLADLYNVTATIRMPGGHEIVWKLHKIDGMLHFKDDAGVVDIIDNNTDENLSFMQNIQRLNWYTTPGDEYGLTYNDFESPLGDYEIEFKAERKFGNVEPVVLTIKAHVELEQPEPEQNQDPEV